MKSDQQKTKAELISELEALRKGRAQPSAQPAANPFDAEAAARLSARFDQMCELIPGVLVEIDPRGRIQYASPSVLPLLGYSPHEIIEQQRFDSSPPETPCPLLEVYRSLIANPTKATTPCRIRHRRGHWVWLDSLAKSQVAANGEEFLTAVSWDAIAAAEQDADLRESSMRYRILAENAGDLIFEVDSEGRFLFLSPNCAAVFSTPLDTILGKTLAEHGLGADLHPDDHRAVAEAFRHGLETPQETRVRFRFRYPDGSWHWLECVANPFAHHDGTWHAVVICRDVTEAEQARLDLRDSEKRFRVVTEISQDFITEADEGVLVFANRAVEESVCERPGEMVGMRVDEVVDTYIHPDDGAKSIEYFQSLKEIGDIVRFPAARYRHKDGSWRWYKAIGTIYQTPSGVRRYLEVSQDITEAEQARLDLYISEARFRTVTEISQDLICEVDETGKMVFANRALTELTSDRSGYFVGMNTEQVFELHIHPDDVPEMMAVYESVKEIGVIVRFPRARYRRRDGSWGWFQARATIYETASGNHHYLEVSQEITDEVLANERRQAIEDQMKEAQRLECLGVMAGGIAHDFNNLLTPILGDASLALLDLPTDSPIAPRLQKIQRAAHRAAALTNQMLAYSGQRPTLTEPLDFSPLVEEMAQLLEGAISREATLVYDLASDLPPLLGDSAQLSQVVMNLVTNAAEAVSGVNARITIRTGVVDREKIDPAHLIGGLDEDELSAKTYVFVEVIDNGCGMDAETQAKIFDPFFTTKFTGRGLGLAAIRGIVRTHRGVISLESETGRGTRFQVLFPVVTHSAVQTAPPKAPRGDWRGSGTVLVVDDDAGVRDLAAETLRRVGLTVLLGRDGVEGIEIFRDHADKICAVVLDRTMPALGGEEVSQQIRNIRPDARVILMSGYSESHFDSPVPENIDSFLHKPFEPSELVEKVRHILDES